MDKVVKVYLSRDQAEKNKGACQIAVKTDNGYILVDYNIYQIMLGKLD